jgi:Holliday junction resolvasome RuvABC endonuclease subunit
MRRVAMGTDPGVSSLGLGVIGRSGSAVELLDHATVHPKGESLTEKEREIYQRATAMMRQHHPLVLGIEDQLGVAAAARANQNRKAAAVAKGLIGPEVMGFNASNDGVIEVVGVIKAAAFAYGVPIVLMQPRSISLGILGPGQPKTEKAEVKKLVKARLCLIIPSLRDVRISLHATDALAAAFVAERQSAQESARAS